MTATGYLFFFVRNALGLAFLFSQVCLIFHSILRDTFYSRGGFRGAWIFRIHESSSGTKNTKDYHDSASKSWKLIFHFYLGGIFGFRRKCWLYSNLSELGFGFNVKRNKRIPWSYSISFLFFFGCFILFSPRNMLSFKFYKLG